jgi:quinol monooxygenase YgiN
MKLTSGGRFGSSRLATHPTVRRHAFSLDECASRDSDESKEGGNYMSVLVLVEAPVKSEDVSNMKSYMAEILPGSRAYDGCQAIDVYFNTEEEGNMILVEYWDSRPHHEKYLGWRTETGVMDKIGGMLAGPPRMRYFERADA